MHLGSGSRIDPDELCQELPVIEFRRPIFTLPPIALERRRRKRFGDRDRVGSVDHHSDS